MISLPILIERNKMVFSFLASRFRGIYKFSRNDLFLYFNERYHIQHHHIYVISHHDKDLVLLEIDGRHIFWPSEIAHDDLSWLFGEIFAPWVGNPSSYNHPAMEIDKAEWVVDAGACEGFFSLFALEKGARRVIAVEPLELLCTPLKKTFSEHIDSGKFTLFDGALGKNTGTTHLNLDPLHACNASVDSAGTGQLVKLTTLDELVYHYNLQERGMIKMDIEGAEMDALLGATQLLRNYKPKLAIAVYHGYDNAALCASIIKSANPSYKIEFRGMYGWLTPPRPYMLNAW